jgi:hypothetical protein
MIQRWTGEKSASDQTALQVHFLFVFHEIPDDDICQTYCVPSNRSGQLVEECNENNISKSSMIQRWIPKIWPQEHYWFSSKSAAFSPYLLFSILFFSFLFFF